MNYIKGRWRNLLHLEPPRGWLNDPNGLCFFKGNNHVYFQYTPASADGNGDRCWGHYESPDFLNWRFTGTVLVPDCPDDKDGVYSGSAVVSGDNMEIFYTGNVKHEGFFDYVNTGRGANVIRVTTTDGHNMSAKNTVLTNADYPAFCSCHVRDPKIRYENGKWQMVLGARTRNDRGCVLYYSSDDLNNWKYDGYDFIPEFGYMWECPDMFTLGGHKFLSVSPQGLPHSKTYYQNVFQSGYFEADGGLNDFTEWDYGFDFYAPQSFKAEDGRRILIGWMGIGDIPYTNPTTELGYQHCLTIPREITLSRDGKLLQNPIAEISKLRTVENSIKSGEIIAKLPFDLMLSTGSTSKDFEITIDGSLSLKYVNNLVSLIFSESKLGGGRDERYAYMHRCENVRIIADMSAVEIYLDGGKKVMSTRFYPESESVKLSVNGARGSIYSLKEMAVKYDGE